MLSPTLTARPWRRTRTVLGIVLALAVVAFAAYGLVAQHAASSAPSRIADHTQQSVVASAPAPHDVGTTPDGDLTPIATTADPDVFVRDVTHALFDWDTTGAHDLSAHKGRLLVVADPTGFESPGLVADLAVYLPTVELWQFLSTYSTRQWIEITSISTPTVWGDVVASAADGALAPGTTARTVIGVRHRAGVWHGEAVTESFDVSFTAFVVCEPTYPTCSLLRLSQLDTPLW